MSCKTEIYVIFEKMASKFDSTSAILAIKDKFHEVYSNQNYNIMTYCITKKRIDIVKFMIECGADPFLKDKSNCDILDVSCAINYLEAVKFILSLSSFKTRKQSRGYDGQISYDFLIYACQNGCYETLEYLLNSDECKNVSFDSLLRYARTDKIKKLIESKIPKSFKFRNFPAWQQDAYYRDPFSRN